MKTFLSTLNICLIFLTLSFFNTGCQEPIKPYGNPAASGFHLEQSDAKAIAIADSVMAKMGGRKAWDETRFISWDFFGSRQLLWDKKENRVKITSARDKYELVLNMDDDSGMLKLRDTLQTNPDSLKKYLTKGKEIWINDSYWLVMPFKLKDSGTTLKYVREDSTEAGGFADVLELTFADVGVTPENKYEVYVDKKSGLVTEWAFFPTANDSIPRFKTPWRKYKKHGQILLSEERSENYSLKPVAVLSEVKAGTFDLK